MSSLELKLTGVIADLFKLNTEDVPEASMESVDEWNSLSHIELMMALEEEFEVINITSDEIVEMTTYASIKRTLQAKGVEF